MHDKRLAFAVVAAASLGVPAVAGAERAGGPLQRDFAIAGYATGWEGSYGGAGVGGRIRVPLWSWAGLDLFSDAVLVESPVGTRHDHPVGFNVFVPIRLSTNARLRPFLGMCAVFSMIEPENDNVPRADDILFGAHLGVGVEVGFAGAWSWFADVKGTGYVGHDREVAEWTGGVDGDYGMIGVVQGSTGLQAHFDL